jgi:nicotinate-nucleotide adenylyltransferase
MDIAIVGGSFDPPHLAHVEVLQHLLNSKRFDEIWVVPAGQHPFKKASASFKNRIAMCHLAFDPLGKKVKIVDEDEKLSGYTIDLIKHLHNKFSEYHWTFVGGSDLKEEISRWKEPQTLKKYLDLEFLPRPPDPASPFAPISSTEIRERIKNRLSIDDFVSNAVKDYIDQHGLYL